MIFNIDKLLHLLHVKPEEVKIVSFTFIFTFCMGIVLNILYSVPLAMFLARYNSSLLPYIYIGVGIAVFFGGLALSYLERVVAVFYVLSIPLGIFSSSLFFFWAMLFAIKSSWIFIVLLIWALMIGFLMISIILLLVNQLFTFQQSKRLFGLILCGTSTGGMLVGFGMDFLVKSIGSNNVILLASLILFLGFMIQFLIRKHSGNRLLLTGESKEIAASEISFKRFENKKYILQVFLFTALVFFIHYSFDLLFNTSVQKHFSNEAKIAAFYGMLNAAYDTTILFTGFFLTGWIFSRFGLIVALLLWPMLLVIFLSAAFFANLIPIFSGFVFPILVVATILSGAVKDSITDESVLLLFQPLRPLHRAWLQIKNAIMIGPLALVFVGVVLLIIEKYFKIEFSFMFIMIIGASIAGVIIAFFVLKKGYLKLLINSLSKRTIISPQFTQLEKESLNVLKNHLKSRYPEEVIYVLQTIENIDLDEFVKILPETLDNPSEEVCCFSLNKIEQYRIQSMEEKLKQICVTEKKPAVLGCALLALGAITDLDQFAWFKNYLHDSNIEVVGSSVTALIKYGSETAKKMAIESLIEKAKSLQEEDRLTAAGVLRRVDILLKVDLLLPLLKDFSLEVRAIASEAAASVVDEKLYPALIENLEIPHTHDAAFYSLLLLGEPVFKYVAQNFAHLPRIQAELINLLGFMKGDKVSDFLQKLLPISNRKALHAILLSLKRHAYKANDDNKLKIINELLESENKNIIYLKEIKDYFASENTRLLHDLLCREIELSKERCFLLLAFIYDEISIVKAHQGLLLNDEDTNSNAIELLIHTLNNKDQMLLMEQLTYSPYKEEKESILDDAKTEEFLLKIAAYTPHCFISALFAAVIYVIGALQLKNLAEFVRKQESKEDPLIKEIVPWTLKKISISG